MNTRGIRKDFNQLLNPFRNNNNSEDEYSLQPSVIPKRWTCSVCGASWIDYDLFRNHIMVSDTCADTPQNNPNFFIQKRRRTTEQIINNSHFTPIDV